MTTVGTVELIAKIDTSQYKRGAAEIDKTNQNIASSTEKASSKTGKAWNDASRIATAAILAFSAIAIKSFVDSASEIQSLRASFLSLTGNVKDTNAVMTTLADLSKRTAFQNKDIQAAGRNYLAAGVSIKNLNKVLSATADIAGATGADLGQLTLPLTQAVARGKLQTQDFYQILNSGAGALRKPLTELAGKKGFGSLAEALEKGEITSSDLLKTMQKVTKQGGFAFEGALKQSQTFAGRMSNLQEAITKVGLSILGVDAVTGEVNPGGAFDRLSQSVSAATDFLTTNGETIKQVGTVITILLTPAIIRLGVEGLIAGAKLAAGILLALGPIGLIVAAIGAATALIIYNWDTVSKFVSGVFQGIVNSVVGLWRTIVRVFSPISGYFAKIFGNAFAAVRGAFAGIVGFFRGIWSAIVGVFGGLGRAIGNAIGGAFKGVINGVIGFVESTVNGIIRSINSVAEGIDKALPGDQSGWRVPEVHLPRLAEGGIVTSPTLAMIGEGGESEAVIPLSKLSEILGKNGSSSGGAGDTYNITLNAGILTSKTQQMELADLVVKNIEKKRVAKGIA
jgi:tape measure domain-containing protein